MTTFNLYQGDCLKTLKKMEDNSVDSIVTDPPYGISFMGKKWDYDVPSKEIWEECLRVLKPGGHLLAFAGTRTQHRMCVNIEDAGFEIRDMLAWAYGSGFPKSLDVSKAINAQIKTGGSSPKNLRKDRQGEDYQPTGQVDYRKGRMFSAEIANDTSQVNLDDVSKQWQGWGTALKPALEPITLARKPFKQTVAKNVLKYGTGGINIDGCRVGETGARNNGNSKGTVGSNSIGVCGKAIKMDYGMGRFPANLIHDGSQEIVETFGESSRFFYCAKASVKDRDEGLDEIDSADVTKMVGRKEGSAGANNPRAGAGRLKPQGGKGNGLGRICETCGVAQLKAEDCKCPTKSWVNPPRKNHHPTVKPTELMRYLVRLITPPGGTVLDPFMGSGSTGKACMYEGFNFIGCELDKDFIEIARNRIQFAIDNKHQEKNKTKQDVVKTSKLPDID